MRADELSNSAGNSEHGGQPDEPTGKQAPGSQMSASLQRRATELGKPVMVLQEGGIRRQLPSKRRLRRRRAGGGVGLSSGEASNDRGAKGRQI